MKTLKVVTDMFYSVLFMVVFGLAFATYLQVPPAYTIGALAVVSIAASFFPRQKGALLDTVYREVWTGELIKYLTRSDQDSFTDGIPDYSQYVANVGDESQVIHLVDMNVLPDVLINNSTYPIPEQILGQADVPISLDKFQTKVTPITDDELYALSYKKMETVKNRHGLAISISKLQKSIHALAPTSNTAKMPVLLTTGADDGTGRKRLIWADILALKNAFDKAGVPKEMRRLVLCDDHVNDLLAPDEKFKDQYYNRPEGVVYKAYGFEIRDYSDNPYYNPTTKAKLSFGAVPTATDRQASVAFSLHRAAKATGWTKMYYSAAENDPGTQRNLINFRHNAIVLPTGEEARGAIVSDNVI